MKKKRVRQLDLEVQSALNIAIKSTIHALSTARAFNVAIARLMTFCNVLSRSSGYVIRWHRIILVNC